MSSRDTKIKRTLLESGLVLLAKEYEKNPSYGHTRVHDNMVPWALRALVGAKIEKRWGFSSRISSINLDKFEPFFEDRPEKVV